MLVFVYLSYITEKYTYNIEQSVNKQHIVQILKGKSNIIHKQSKYRNKYDWMNGWMSERTNERTLERTNEWMNEKINI